MCAEELGVLVKNLNFLGLPSTLWAVHVDPKHEFIAILHVNVDQDKILMDRGVIVSSENCSIKTTVTLNGEIVHLTGFSSKVETVNDLTNLICTLHNVKFCPNSSTGNKCSKYVLGNEATYCELCEFEALAAEASTPGKLDLDCISLDDPLYTAEEVQKEEKKRNFLCTTCGKTFVSHSSLDLHLATHSSEKPFKCKICGRGFAKKYNLNVHARIHSGERPFVCSKCGKTYATRSNLSTHMKSSHLDGKKYGCELCEMNFVHPRMLRIHMRKHTGEKPFLCGVCGKMFAKKVHLTIHMRTHTGEKPFLCGVCGKAFTTTGNLSAHKKSNHRKTE